MTRRILWAVLCFLTAGETKAQLLVPEKTEFHFILPDSANKKRNWVDPVVYTGLSFLAATSYLFVDPTMQHETQENLTDWQRFSAYAITPLGSGRNNWYAVGATTVAAIAFKDQKLKKTIVVWVGALAINDLFTNQLKVTFQRHRPSSGDTYNTFDWRGGPQLHKSFPSAHTSNIFATATTFASMYRDKKWVPPFAYSLATLVGISRVYRNAHWASDVIAGALVGYFSARCSEFLVRKLTAKWKNRPEMLRY